jgi:hypothetical protein
MHLDILGNWLHIVFQFCGVGSRKAKKNLEKQKNLKISCFEEMDSFFG